jgi:MFS family permease
MADRVGRRRTLVAASLVIAVMAIGYGVTSSYRVMLALVLAHGVFWSALLSASSAYTMDLIPATRRAEGLGYWGLSTVLAVAVAPTIGLWIYRHGWSWLCVSVGALNLLMAAIAFALPPEGGRRPVVSRVVRSADLVEWRVAVVAITLFLCAFGYGGVTSFVAMYAEANGVAPRGIFFTAFAVTIVFTRPFLGRLADRLGHVRVLIPCLALVVLGYALLAIGGTYPWLVAAAVVFGTGFGSTYPIFAAYVMQHVGSHRRGAAFGGILAALDTGIGTGSIVLGWMIQRHGFATAYALAAAVATLATPYFLLVRGSLPASVSQPTMDESAAPTRAPARRQPS